jgi:hypothetical protein
MQPYARVIPIAVLLTGALLFIATAVKSQAPAQSLQVWEYSSVTGSPNLSTISGILSSSTTSAATICYATAQGCRLEQVTTTSERDLPRGAALMMAADKLGEQGWELTSATDVATNSLREQVLYFRRLKSDSK